MSFTFTLTDEQGYLRVTASGSPVDAEEMSRYLDDIFREAKQRGYVCMLVDETQAHLRFDIVDTVLKNRLSAIENQSGQAVNVALVSAPHSLELYKFFEGMLRERAFNYKSFDDLEQGRQWLRAACRKRPSLNRSYTYAASEKNRFAHIVLKGRIDSVYDVLTLYGDLLREAAAIRTTCILLDSRACVFELDVPQAFKVAQTLGDYIPLLGMRIASVPDSKTMELDKFFETVFQNRSINYRLFESEEEAEKWILLRQCRSGKTDSHGP